jgi:RNA binding exosome subunit
LTNVFSHDIHIKVSGDDHEYSCKYRCFENIKASEGVLKLKRSFIAILFVLLFGASFSYAGFLDDMLKKIPSLSSKQELDDSTVISGLKEALSIGTANAVKEVSRTDGYFGNNAIKILMPEKLQKVADVLRKIGFEKPVDDFILSMNRAAEKAAPKAADYFVDSVKEMSVEDAKKILNGGDTAATDFFKSKTYDKLFSDFKPVISSSMDEVGVTRSYKEMMAKYSSIPFMKTESLDVDNYVTNKALDGLFYMVAQEEKKIRTDPAARVTELLKKVFGR